MPELPEVETVVRGLAREVVGRRVEAVEVRLGDRMLPSPEVLAAGLDGRSFVAARRFGKHLFLDLDDDCTLAGHLRMTGQLRTQARDEPMMPHTHLVLTLDDGRTLRWRDVRRFGWLHLCRTAELGTLPSLAGCGPDALEVGEDEFVARVRGVRRGMKALLLAQDVVCGLGNIYADEVLFRGRIHPLAISGELGVRRVRALHQAVRETLGEAIAARGTSIDGAYVAVDGLAGGYQRRLAVYGREGRPCVRCGRPVRRILVSSRSTCYCPRCQRR